MDTIPTFSSNPDLQDLAERGVAAGLDPEGIEHLIAETKARGVTCKYCQRSGLAWYKARSGKNYLAERNPDGSPNRSATHFCIFAPGSFGNRPRKGGGRRARKI